MRTYREFELRMIADAVTLQLTRAGFTRVTIKRQDMPQASFENCWKEDDGRSSDPSAFSDEICYHRVKTDQAEFGFWMNSYPTLDLTGVDVDCKVFCSDAKEGEISDGRMFIGMGADVFTILFAALAKKQSQP